MKKRFTYLLIPLMLLLLLQPVAAQGYTPAWANTITELAVVAGALMVLRNNRKVMYLVGGLLALAVLAVPAGLIAASSLTGVIGTLAVVSSMVVTLLAIAYEAVREDWVTGDTILGAMVVYLLLGITFALVFELFYRFYPHAFNNVSALTRPGRMAEMIYFSMVSITTLGYGDITPNLGFVRILAVMEAVVGQFFVAAVLGVLVSRHGAQKKA